jgi:hypothetical protein
MVYRIDDEAVFLSPSSRDKAFRVQQLRFDDGTGFAMGHTEYRVCYYRIAHRPRMKGKWALGQFAPFMTPQELALIISTFRGKGWLVE